MSSEAILSDRRQREFLEDEKLHQKNAVEIGRMSRESHCSGCQVPVLRDRMEIQRELREEDSNLNRFPSEHECGIQGQQNAKELETLN